MGYYGYPEKRWAPNDAEFVVTSLSPGLINSKLLVPGPGIAITVMGNQVIVTNTGGGGGGAPSNSTYITQLDETLNLPNSFRIVQGPGIGIVYGTSTVTFTPVAYSQSFITAVAESSLPGDRLLTTVAPVSGTDGGAGGNYTIQISPGLDYQVLGTASQTVTYLYGADLGFASNSGGGTVTLAASSESVQLFDCTAGPYTVNMPDPTTCINKSFILKKFDVSTNFVNIIGNIDDQSSISIVLPYQTFSLRSIGNFWVIV